MDRGLNELLKWSIENTPTSATNPANGDSAATGDAAAPTQERAPRNLNPEVLASLFGGPSEAELMQAAMAVICNDDPTVTLENKLIAFDNFEQLIESLDNANNLGPLSLWSPLLTTLDHDEPEMRLMAAWCVGTAVQNNAPSQERLLALGGVPRLVALATKATERADVRRKAVYALSSACRNYQPAMDECVVELGKLGKPVNKVDAQDMDAVDSILNPLKEAAKNAA